MSGWITKAFELDYAPVLDGDRYQLRAASSCRLPRGTRPATPWERREADVDRQA